MPIAGGRKVSNAIIARMDIANAKHVTGRGNKDTSENQVSLLLTVFAHSSFSSKFVREIAI